MLDQTIKTIHLTNFRRFRTFNVRLGEVNILVGPNNSGKSSILDSLRILYGARRYAVRLRPTVIQRPEGAQFGYEIPDSSIPVTTANITRDFNDDEAIITFTHANGEHLKIIMSNSRATQLYIPDTGPGARTGQEYFAQFPVDVVIVPPLSPLEQQEPYLSEVVVERERSTRLSSRHFRNLWYRDKKLFPTFKALVEETWPSIKIDPPDLPHIPHPSFEMFFYEDRMAREIAWSGFGLQIWLQIVSHVLRGTEKSIFVLDEPDIYLHPDMQRKLLSLISGRFAQYLLASHSTEIINEAEVGDLLTISADRSAARRVRTDAEYNQLYSYIGSLENIDLAKLARAKRVVFFEGNDKRILRRFAKRAGVDSLLGNNDTIVIGVGGFGRWSRVVETAWTFKNVLQVDVAIFALFDRDYRDDRDVTEMIGNVEASGVRCAVWNRKEIENYALELPVLVRVIGSRCKERGVQLSESDILTLIGEVSSLFKHDVYGQILGQSVAYERRVRSDLDISTVAKSCSIEFELKWADLQKRLYMLSGKDFIGTLSMQLQEKYGATVTANILIDALSKTEISPELVRVVQELVQFEGQS